MTVENGMLEMRRVRVFDRNGTRTVHHTQIRHLQLERRKSYQPTRKPHAAQTNTDILQVRKKFDRPQQFS